MTNTALRSRDIERNTRRTTEKFKTSDQHTALSPFTNNNNESYTTTTNATMTTTTVL